MARNTLFLLLCMKTKAQFALIITPEKLAVFNEGFSHCDLCQLSDLSFAARGAWCHKLGTQHTRVCQQVSCALHVSRGSKKFCTPI